MNTTPEPQPPEDSESSRFEEPESVGQSSSSASTPNTNRGDFPSQPISFLEEVFSQPVDENLREQPGTTKRFLDLETPREQLEFIFGSLDGWTKQDVTLILNREIAELDEVLNEQVNAIIHHPQFQRLEASWRGLAYTVSEVHRQGAGNIKIRVLQMTWRELTRDFERANDFDQSQFFRKVYEDEFGMPGGEPYGLLIGDYEIHPRPTEDHPFDDIKTLSEISQVAAAAFCPFVTSASPSMLGLNEFTGIQNIENIARGFEGDEYIKWRAFRESDDARFVGLTLPRVLLRRPWEQDIDRKDGFCFDEENSARDRSGYLWGNASFAFAEVAIRAFAQSGWLAEIRGVQRDVEWGGLVTGLPTHCFGTDRNHVAPKTSTDVSISDVHESALSHLGFLPLMHCWDTEYSAFYGSQSAQKPRKYDTSVATQNSKISSMLHYMLCVSRFAHYLKVIARDKIGSHLEPAECQKVLDRWIKNYVTPDDHATAETKSRRPLREADIRIVRDPEKPGSYVCTMNLRPHYQLDDMTASLRLLTSLQPLGARSDVS